jgi:hypothetical protein
MKLFRTAAVVSIGRLVYQQARKPENQARIKAMIEKRRSQQAGHRSPGRSSV